MPKEIKSAADILGAVSPEGDAAPIAATQPPAEVVVAEPAAPAAGFENPPVEEAPVAVADEAAAAVEEAAPTAEELLTGAVAPSAAAPLQAKEAVIPAKKETIAPTEPEIVEIKVPAVQAPKTEWKFVKNVHFGEKIIFEDGSEYAFRSPLHIVRDPGIAKKILAVAKRYNIVEQ